MDANFYELKLFKIKLNFLCQCCIKIMHNDIKTIEEKFGERGVLKS